MKWTDVRPSKEGLYLNRIGDEVCAMSVRFVGGVLCVQAHSGFNKDGTARLLAAPVGMVTGQWSDVPIPEPEEA